MKNVTNTLFPSFVTILWAFLSRVVTNSKNTIFLILFGCFLASSPSQIMAQCEVGDPNITIGTSPICVNEDQLTVTATVTGFVNPFAQWIQSTPILLIANPTSTSTTVTGVAPGTVELRLQVTELSSSGDCPGQTITSNPITIEVDPNVTGAIASITSGSSPVCKDETLNLFGNASSSLPIIHSWSIDPPITPSPFSNTAIPNPVFTAPDVLVSTNYTITYMASNAEGCDDQATLLITVNPPVSVAVNNTTFDVCANPGSLLLNGNPTGGSGDFSSGAASHNWVLIGGTAPFVNIFTLLDNPSLQTPTLTPGVTATDGQTYILRYTATDSEGCARGCIG